MPWLLAVGEGNCIFFVELLGFVTLRESLLTQAAGLQHPMEAVIDNIWDLAQPAAHDRITLKDLINSQNGGLFVLIVSSALQFINYDQRET